jgi:ribonucleoside-triphosphate reductase (thioredoxin)
MDKFEYADKLFSDFIYIRTYSRYLWEEGRRETWEETVDRYCNYVFSKCKNADKIPEKVKIKCRKNLLERRALGSMRALWASGEAADNNNASMYNCSFIVLDRVSAFSDAVLLLMNGTGVGFSNAKEYIDNLPTIKHQRNIPPIIFTIEDSKEGWAKALYTGMDAWFSGRDCKFDYSKIRPLGSPLKTFGGISSGPEPLRQLLDFTRETILEAQGRKLSSLECHDIMCECGSVVISGGSRRSALASIGSLDDLEMRSAKEPPFHPRRWLSNNSAIYTEKPDVLVFMDEWAQLAKSGTGERGIFNLYAARKNAPKRRKAGLIDGCNPCFEILLRKFSMCNLSTVVVKAGMDFDDLRDSITSAVWLGAVQSTFIAFNNLDPDFAKNCEEERLLGVSITGIMDNPLLFTEEKLELLKKHAIKTAKHVCKILDINMSAAVTTIKPEGTTSSLCGTSSGIHCRYADFYIRRVRISKHQPLYQMMVDQGMKGYPAPENSDTMYFEFPQKSPEGAITRKDMTALDQLNWYFKFAKHYTEHNPSCTVYVKPWEWLKIADAVFENWNILNGVSFFPYDDHAYEAAPFEEISEEVYNRMISELPKIDFSLLSNYEKDDQTEGAKTYACSGGSCDVQ